VTADLVVHGGQVVYGDAVIEDAGVAIKDGLIVATGPTGTLPEAQEMVDVDGDYILPGLIDPHVHFREPGLTDREDFGTGSTAAAMGGMTAVFDMPNTKPATATGELVEAKRDLVGAKALVDFGLYGLVAQDNLNAISGMADAGVIAFKFYLHQAMSGHEPCDDGALLEGFERVAETGMIAAVHCENRHIIRRRTEQLKEQGRHDAAANLEARPDVSESEMVERCISYARAAGTRLHICHATSARTVELVREAKRRGQAVTAETGPQWLYFTQEDVVEKGTILFFSPPFRDDHDRQALWEGVADGTLDYIASDHAPRHDREKHCCSVWDCVSGFPGVETSAVLLLTAVSEGRIDLPTYAKAASERAARTFGLWPRKGSLVPGTDGDVTVVTLDAHETIDAARLHSRVVVTPYDGQAVTARVRLTIIGGRIVVRDGELVVAPPGGQDLGLPATRLAAV
jgi:dihydroorotase